jgi:hypothetical protein
VTIRARVFSKDGNRFLVPGYWTDETDENWQGMSMEAVLIGGMILSVVGKMDSTLEWLDIEPNDAGKADVLHVPYQLVGSVFAHGSIDILLISGPLFDQVAAGKEPK